MTRTYTLYQRRYDGVWLVWDGDHAIYWGTQQQCGDWLRTMQHQRASMNAKCVKCGEDKPVCCDSGFKELEDGTYEHDDPYCAGCCPNNVNGKPRPQIWDGKSVAGGTYERCV